MPMDNVKLNVNYEGTKGELDERLRGAVEEAFKARTGLELGDLAFTTDNLEVNMKSSGVLESNVYSGTGGSIDVAIERAESKISSTEPTINASADVVVEAPYFTVSLTSRSLKPERVDRWHQAAVDQLMDTYGNRVDPMPDSVEFVVMKTKKPYRADGDIPRDGIGSRRILASGSSSISFEDAEGRLSIDERALSAVRSTVYQQTSQMVVYGEQETATPGNFLAATAVLSRGVRHVKRAAPPAAGDPTYLSSPSASLI